MVNEQVAARGISDPLVLEAMRRTPRHLFVEEAMSSLAYDSCCLPIGYKQTISLPYVVGWMSQLLRAEARMRVLEIGTGSGYQAAVLSNMGLRVHTVERLPELHKRAARIFEQLKLKNILMKKADGTMGWADAGPYERIIVTAGGPSVPEPLLAQLGDPGIMVIPVGPEKGNQRMLVVRKEGGRVITEDRGEVVFVDLVGSYGWYA